MDKKITWGPHGTANGFQNLIVFVFSILPCQVVLLAHPCFDSRERMV